MNSAFLFVSLFSVVVFLETSARPLQALSLADLSGLIRSCRFRDPAIPKERLNEVRAMNSSQFVYSWRKHWIVKEPHRFEFDREVEVAMVLHALGQQRFYGVIEINDDFRGSRKAYLVEKVRGATVADHFNFYREEAMRLNGYDTDVELYEPYANVRREFDRFKEIIAKHTPLLDVHEENVMINTRGDFVIIDALLKEEIGDLDLIRARLDQGKARGAWRRVLVPAALLRPLPYDWL